MYGTIDTELAWGIFPGSNTSMFSDQKRASVSFARLTVSRVPILSDVLSWQETVISVDHCAVKLFICMTSVGCVTAVMLTRAVEGLRGEGGGGEG
jgi:hypothetical protein